MDILRAFMVLSEESFEDSLNDEYSDAINAILDWSGPAPENWQNMAQLIQKARTQPNSINDIDEVMLKQIVSSIFRAARFQDDLIEELATEGIWKAIADRYSEFQ